MAREKKIFKRINLCQCLGKKSKEIFTEIGTTLQYNKIGQNLLFISVNIKHERYEIQLSYYYAEFSNISGNSTILFLF